MRWGTAKRHPFRGKRVSSHDRHRRLSDRRRLAAGGVTVFLSISGFLSVQVAIDMLSYPDDWVLFALPVFGIVGVIGLVVLVSGALRG